MVGEAMWESPGGDGALPSSSSSSSSSSLGRVMHTILSSRPGRLKAAIAELGPSPSKSASGALLDESLCFFWRHVEDAAKKEEPLDHVLVPLIERSKEPKGSNQVFILIRWLCRNELLLQAILVNLTEIITNKADHFTAFGWCTFVRSLVELSSDQFFEGEEERHHLTLLKILCRSIPRLLVIASEGSTFVDGFELPTRLAVAAADCILVLTEALTKKEFLSRATSSQKLWTDSKKKSELIKMISLSDSEKERNQTQVTDASDDIGSEFLLWHYLNELVILVEKLEAWSRKSLPLQEKGLKRVRKWLLEIKEYYSFVQDEAGGELLRNGVLLLSSCWKHYGMLLRFEKYKSSQDYFQVLDQYLSGLEFYTEHGADGDPMKVKSSIETRRFFLNCIALFWGKLPAEQRKTATSEAGIKLVNTLLSQLKCDSEDLVEISISIMREVIFRTDSQSGGCAADTHQLQRILPMLLSLLDERDSTAKAVILLMAELCYVYPSEKSSRDGPGIMEILKLLASGSHSQKKNAIDVIVELVHGYSDGKNKISSVLWQEIANHLLEYLGDEGLVDHVLESSLFPCLDPSFVLPQLIHLSYSSNEKVGVSSATALSSVLSHHNEFSVIEILLDSLSDVIKNSDFSLKTGTSEKHIEGRSPLLQSGPKLDIDRVLKLTPGWSESVTNFDSLIDQLIDKMFLDPSNHVLLRFLSYLSERLAEAGDLVLHRVLLHMQGQEDMDESLVSDRRKESFESENAIRLKSSLFSRLCPLLVIRLLPLKIFDNLGSSTLYGVFRNEENWKAQRDACMTNRDSIAALLVDRAFGLFEYEDVRKLAAELCGRLHPQVLVPIVAYHMKSASESRDVLKLKACLFAVCTSLVARGSGAASHPSMAEIRRVIDCVLSWPAVDADEVPKAQHGCVDCLALMICAEVQSPGPRDHPGGGPGDADTSVLARVMQRLASESPSPDDRHELGSSPAFRLFMAGVLISACQKVASSGRSELARGILSALVPSLKQSIADSEVRPACLQVLFSAVYHLKSSVLPYSMDLLKLSIKALKRGSEKEKIAAAKLLASLLASEDAIVERISAGLVEAKSALAGVSTADSSSRELRQLCEPLLACLTSPLESLMLGARRPPT